MSASGDGAADAAVDHNEGADEPQEDSGSDSAWSSGSYSAWSDDSDAATETETSPSAAAASRLASETATSTSDRQTCEHATLQDQVQALNSHQAVPQADYDNLQKKHHELQEKAQYLQSRETTFQARHYDLLEVYRGLQSDYGMVKEDHDRHRSAFEAGEYRSARDLAFLRIDVSGLEQNLLRERAKCDMYKAFGQNLVDHLAALHPTSQSRCEYVYQSIDAEREIRLVNILPALKAESDLRCTITHHPLHPAPSYEAVSYTWGQARRTQKIGVGCAEYLHVTKNRKAVLNALRLAYRIRTVWIDAICINQGDIVERSAQVEVMGDVYKMAVITCVYLGEPASS